MPRLNRLVDVTATECNEMMRTGIYVDKSQKHEVQHILKPYRDTNYFSTFPVGRLQHYNNRVSECQGETYSYPGDRHKSTQVIIAQDLAVTMKQIDVQIRFKTKELIMVEMGHQSQPN